MNAAQRIAAYLALLGERDPRVRARAAAAVTRAWGAGAAPLVELARGELGRRRARGGAAESTSDEPAPSAMPDHPLAFDLVTRPLRAVLETVALRGAVIAELLAVAYPLVLSQ